ncbi:MAG: hypothetical protein WBA46_05815 [Thermomicrobiales bacterium]
MSLERRLERVAEALFKQPARKPLDFRMFSNAQMERLAGIAERIRDKGFTVAMLPEEDRQFLEEMDALWQGGAA